MASIPQQNIRIDSNASLQKNYLPALATLGVLYFMMGFITCLNDTLVPFFKAGFTLSYAESSLVQFYFFLTYGVMSIPAGKLVERTGYKNGIVMGFLIAALGAFVFYPASVYHAYGLFLAALFILAIGIVVLQVAANPYITILGPANTASSRLTLIQGVGSIGTTVAPIFGAAFILSRLSEAQHSSDAVRAPYLGIGALLVLIAVVVFFLKLPSLQAAKDEVAGAGSPKKLFSFRNLNLGIIAIFLYVGAEVSIGTFLTNYISDVLLIDGDKANTYVSFYWGGMLVGRLVGALVLKSVKPSSVLAILAAGAGGLVVLSVCSGGMVAVWSMICVGLCNSVMFAIIFSLSVQGVGRFVTKGSGLLSTAIAGGALVSYAQGLLKDNFSWQVAFAVPVVCYVYLVFYGVNGYKEK